MSTPTPETDAVLAGDYPVFNKLVELAYKLENDLARVTVEKGTLLQATVDQRLRAEKAEAELAKVIEDFDERSAENSEYHNVRAQLYQCQSELASVRSGYHALRARNAEPVGDMRDIAGGNRDTSEVVNAALARAESPTPANPFYDAFGRDDVEILRVDGNDKDMPSTITIRVGERTGVFERNDSTAPAPTLDDAAEAALNRVRGIGARHDSEIPDAAMGGVK